MNRFYNERPYGVGEYVDHLLGEQQVLLKRELREHTENNDIHVTAEDKERWNSTSEAIFGSSDSSDGDTSSTIIPTKVSDLVNDEGYLKEIPSYYATEDEVRSWLGNYVTTATYEADKGNHYSDNEEEYVDGDIIDKFQIDDTKAALAGAKSVYLVFEDNKLSVKVAKAQTASINTYSGGDVVNFIEYGQSATVVAMAGFTSEEMNSVKIYSSSNPTPVDVTETKQTTYQVNNMQNPITYTVSYTPKDDVSGTSTKTVYVGRKLYTWASSSGSESSIPQNATGVVYAGNPAPLNISLQSGQYQYVAYPNVWGISRFIDAGQNEDFAVVEITDHANGYGQGDYTIIRTTQSGLTNKTLKFA